MEANVLLFFFIPFVIVIGIWLIYSNISSTKRQLNDQQKTHKEMESQLLEIPDFEPNQKYHATNCLISLDESSQRIVIIDQQSKSHVYGFQDVIESEIIQNEVTVTKTSRSDQIAGTVIGGALAGGAGAIIGGLSSKQQSAKKVQKLVLKIVVDDLQNPNYYVEFLNSVTPLDIANQAVMNATNLINHWHSVISVILKRNNSPV